MARYCINKGMVYNADAIAAFNKIDSWARWHGNNITDAGIKKMIETHSGIKQALPNNKAAETLRQKLFSA
jgi:hypothetical protein